MTEYKTTTLNRNNFNVLNYTREAPRPQYIEDRSRYILISQQQPDQAYHKSFENTPTVARAGIKLTDAAQGLRELHEKINGALKRSSSATSIRPQQNIYANPLVTAINQTQHKVSRTYQTETTHETMESFYEPRTRSSNLYTSTIKVLPNNISTMPVERVVHVNSHTPQATSTNFYLGGLNPNSRNAEELLHSVKNYQVKTIHTLDSSRKHYTSQNTTQNLPEKIYVQQPTGASIKLKNFTTQTEFQPGYDKEKLDSVISKIMNSHQNYPPMRQDSFVSPTRTANVTNYESYANSRVYESRVLRDNSREIPQQYYHPRPLQTVVNKVPVQMVYRRPINEKKAPTMTEQSLKKSYIGEMQPDGDSMCEFLKENDQLLDFEEEVKPNKKGREADSENFFVKKVPKRQEIINSKKLGRSEPQHEQSQRQRKEMNYKNNAPEMPQRNRRRV